MKESFENMDDLFKDRLENYSPEPPLEIWENINSRINKKENYFIKWWQVAASVIVLSTVGLSIWLLKSENDNYLAEDINSQTNNKTVIEDIKKEPVIVKSITEIDNMQGTKQKSHLKNKKTNNKYKTIVPDNSEILATKSETMSENPGSSLSETENNKADKRVNLLAAIEMKPFKSQYNNNHLLANQENKTVIVEKENKKDKESFWRQLSYGGQMTPTLSFYTQPSGGLSSNESPLMKSSGGLYIEGKVSKKITLKTGFYYLNIGSNHDKIYLQKLVSNFGYQPAYPWETYSVPEENEPYYVIFDNSVGEIQLSEDIVIDTEDKELILASNNEDTRTETNTIAQNKKIETDALENSEIYESMDKLWVQQLNNIEIPMIARYKFVDRKKIDFSLITGVSANWLVKNFVIFDDQKIVFAETVNIRRFNMSGTLGIGMEYPLFSKISLTIEPTFKYFLNSINTGEESNRIHPYSFGIYSGIRYSL